MKDQVERLSKIPNIRAIYRDGTPEAARFIRDGAFDYLFGSPELLVGDSTFRDQLHAFDVSTIVVDEFHKIACWGKKDDDDRNAFRKWFSYIGELRSIFPSASVLALSATCTHKICRRVRKVLNLKDDATEIRLSPDKPNIKLVVKKIPNSVDLGMAWIIDQLDSFPRTIIYCNSIWDVSKLYCYITSEVPDSGSFCEMFHSETPDAKKEKILDDLCNEHGSLRIVIATSDLGMGIDITGTNNVILLYGAPKQLVEVVQENGRAGRDGNPALALLLYNSYHLRKVELEVKDVYNSQTCRRKMLLKPFVKESELTIKDPHHMCCDRCMLLCKCDDCHKDTFSLEKMIKDEPSVLDSDTNSDSTELYDDAELLIESDTEFD